MWLKRESREASAALLLEKVEQANSYLGFDPTTRTSLEKAMVAGLAIYLLVEESIRPNRPGPQAKTRLPLLLPPVIESAMTGAPRRRGRPRKYPETYEKAFEPTVSCVRTGMWARHRGGFSSVSELKAYLRMAPEDERRREIGAFPLREVLRLLFPDDPEFAAHVRSETGRGLCGVRDAEVGGN
jgi:hypothetical protein